jgi:hypothetical protein
VTRCGAVRNNTDKLTVCLAEDSTRWFPSKTVLHWKQFEWLGWLPDLGFEWHPGIGLFSCFGPQEMKGPIRDPHRDLYQKTSCV